MSRAMVEHILFKLIPIVMVNFPNKTENDKKSEAKKCKKKLLTALMYNNSKIK